MAVSLDASTPAWDGILPGTNSGAGETQTTNPVTLTSASFTPPSGSLVTVIGMADYEGFPGFSATGLTCADSHSNSYTGVASLPATGAAGHCSFEVFEFYYSASPGATTVTVTLAAAQTFSSGYCVNLVVYVWDGAASNQTGAATATGSGTSATNEVSITPTQTGSQIAVGAGNGNGSAMTAEAGTTTFGTIAGDEATNAFAMGYSTSATSSLTAQTYGWTDGSNVWGGIAVEVIPAGAGTPASPGRQLPNVPYQLVFPAGPSGRGHSM